MCSEDRQTIDMLRAQIKQLTYDLHEATDAAEFERLASKQLVREIVHAYEQLEVARVEMSRLEDRLSAAEASDHERPTWVPPIMAQGVAA